MGHPQSQTTRNKIAKAQTGKGNSNYKTGARMDYRKIAGLKKGDGKITHHEDGNRSNNAKSNLKVIPPSKRGAHDKAHHRENNFKKSGGTKKGAYKKKSHPGRVDLKSYKKPK